MINRKPCILPLVGSLFFIMPIVYAQEFAVDRLLPGFREQALIMNIAASIVEGNHEIVWNSADSRVTIPGRPVGLKLTGSNIAIEVQFTPYLRSNNRNVLVAQGQVWISNPNNGGVSYHTIIETIPLEFEEEIFFFPLGSAESENEALIEIQLVVYPYTNETKPVEPD